MSTARRAFLLHTALILLIRLADALTTYIGTPDLRFESNIAVSVFGMGWLGLALVTGSVAGGIIYALYLYYCRPMPVQQMPARAYESVHSFATIYFFGPQGKLSDFLWRFPSLAPLARWAGYVCGWGVAVWYGLLAVANNLLFAYPNRLTDSYISYNLDRYYTHGALILGLMIYLSVVFFRREYQRAVVERAAEMTLA